MMWHDGWFFWGMHGLWWLFWIALLVVFFVWLRPKSDGRDRETPLDTLQRLYAEGRISREEYEERKAVLEEDARR